MSFLRLPHGWDSPRVAVAGRHLTCVCRWRQSDGSVRQCWSQRGRGNLLSMWLRGRSRPRSWRRKPRRLSKSTKLLVAPLARTCLEHQGICAPLYRGVMLPGSGLHCCEPGCLSCSHSSLLGPSGCAAAGVASPQPGAAGEVLQDNHSAIVREKEALHAPHFLDALLASVLPQF